MQESGCFRENPKLWVSRWCHFCMGFWGQHRRFRGCHISPQISVMILIFWKGLLKVPDHFFYCWSLFFFNLQFGVSFLKQNFCCWARRMFLEGWRATGAWRQDWIVFVGRPCPVKKRYFRRRGGTSSQPLSINGRLKIHRNHLFKRIILLPGGMGGEYWVGSRSGFQNSLGSQYGKISGFEQDLLKVSKFSS